MAKRKYDQQLKKDVIDAVLIGNKSAAQVAREHNIPTLLSTVGSEATKKNTISRDWSLAMKHPHKK